MTNTSDYRRAYEAAKRELADLLFQQEMIGKRLVLVRQTIQTLAIICESEGVEVDPSNEAAMLLEHTTFADEIRAVLSAKHGTWMRPHQIKGELERLGCDLAQYKNPQATIHMVLKRIAESREIEQGSDSEGKTVYMMPEPSWMGPARKAMARRSAEVTGPEPFRPRLGFPDPLNQRGKKK